jgi:DNA-binding LacI/PurR family transcriptional regulator
MDNDDDSRVLRTFMQRQRASEGPALHVQLANALKGRIQSGLWPHGSTIPTEKALCDEFDVARGTMRQALQTLELEGYVRRQQGKGTFVTWSADSRPDSPRTMTRNARLAFVVPYVRDSSVPTIFSAFQQRVENAHAFVSFMQVNNDPRQQVQVLDRLIAEQTAGIALYPLDSEANEVFRRVIAADIPLVLVDRYLKTLSTDSVTSDHFGGALQGVRHLLDHGHTAIGYATWHSPAVSMEHRFLGYQQALRERGLAFNPDWICTVDGYPTIDISPLQALLSQPRRPTAIFAANDQIAIALYRAAFSLDLRVPEDLAVVGFDDLDVAAQLDPPLTTIAQPFKAIGETAADLLLRRLYGERGPIEQITLAPRLVVRGSSRPLTET